MMEAINNRKSIHIFKRIRFIIQQLRESGVNIGKEASDVFDMIDDLAKEALITPPRNCDAGTAEEQQERFKDFCRREDGGTCLCCPAASFEDCVLGWAQLPYESEGTNGK